MGNCVTNIQQHMMLLASTNSALQTLRSVPSHSTANSHSTATLLANHHAGSSTTNISTPDAGWESK
jgi:hypothetical protein